MFVIKMIFIIFIIKLSVKFDTFVTKKNIFPLKICYICINISLVVYYWCLKTNHLKTLNYLTFDALYKFIIAFEKFDTNVTHKQ